MTDRTTKILLGLIAVGLWANFATSFLQPATARSDDLVGEVAAIDFTVTSIAVGHCPNPQDLLTG